MWEVLKQAPKSPRHRAVWAEIETATYRRRWATAGGVVSLKEPQAEDTEGTEDTDGTAEIEPVLTVPRSVWSWAVAKRLVPRILSAVENRREDPGKLDEWRALFIVAEVKLQERSHHRWGPGPDAWVPRLPEQ